MSEFRHVISDVWENIGLIFNFLIVSGSLQFSAKAAYEDQHFLILSGISSIFHY